MSSSQQTGAEGQPDTVLVIEDERDIAALLRKRVERLGHEVVSVASGEEGLARARARRPSLVLLDIRLPGIDGWEVLDQLRDQPELADVPVVIVSIVDDPKEGRAREVQGYLVKPFRRASLDRLVTNLLGEGRGVP